MDTACEKEVRVHQGLNIKRIRMAGQMKQEILAQKIGVAQQTMSKYENQEVVDEKVLEKCASALDIPVDLLKYMPDNEGAPIQIFKDSPFTNTPTDSSMANGAIGTFINNNYPCESETLKVLGEVVTMLKEEIEALKEGTHKPKAK